MSFNEIENTLPQNWEIKKAEEVCERVTDGTHDSPQKKDEGKYLITSRHLNDNSIDLKNAYFISEKDFNKVNERSKVEQWDVLFSMIGTIGETYIEKNSEIEYAIKNIGLFKMNKNELVGKWIYYYLNSKFAKEYVYTHKRGSTQQFLPLGSLRDFPIIIPKNKEIQNKIIIILDSIQNKIENNNKMNQTLEEMAQAIYRNWFIDFEPFQEGEFIESKSGMIPEGWGVKKIKDISKVVLGKTPSTRKEENYGDKYPFIRIPEMHDQMYITDTEKKLSEVGHKTQEKKLIPENSIMVSCIGTVGLVSLNLKPSHTNQQINTINCHDILVEYLYFKMKNMRRKLIKIGSSGTTMSNINKGTFEKLNVLIPNEKSLIKYHTTVKPLFDKIKNNLLENQSLKELRDTLLPKLMSGEIRVTSEK